jgi:hypothetical protein
MWHSASSLFGHEEAGTWVTAIGLSPAGVASCVSPDVFTYLTKSVLSDCEVHQVVICIPIIHCYRPVLPPLTTMSLFSLLFIRGKIKISTHFFPV